MKYILCLKAGQQRNPKQEEKQKFYVSIKSYQLIRLEDRTFPITS
jgi:hypothetical protein